MLEEMKSKFPLSYEIYRIMKTEYAVHKAQKKAIRIHNMSNEELMAYDANLYKKWMGRDLDWNNLQTFTEKMQWAKLFDDDPRKVICADKYAVRSWVKEKIGEEYLIPLLGKWERYSEINFDSLPERFVIKTNHGSGDAIIVRNKSRMTFDEKLEMRRKIKAALRTDFGAHLCEMHYSKISPLIIAEKYLESGEEYLRDYKFQCFDGKIAFC